MTVFSPAYGGVRPVSDGVSAPGPGDRILAQMPVALFALASQPDGRMAFTATAGAFLDVFGVPPDVAELDASAVLQLVHPDDLSDLQQAMETSMGLGEEFAARFRISRPGSGTAWVAIRADPVVQPAGGMAWFGYARLLTPVEVSDLVIEAERHRLVGILWSIDAGTWEWNLLTGAARLDERWAGILGYTLDDLHPVSMETVHGLMHHGDRTAMDEVTARYFAGDQGTFRTTVRMRHRDGHWVWMELRGRLVSRTPDGMPEWMSGIALDDSEAKDTEEQMRTASHYARSLIEASVDPLVTISVDGHIMDVNRATETATGRPRHTLIGSDFSEYFTDPEQARAVYRQVFELGRVVDYPLTISHADGHRIEVLYNASTYLDRDGRVAGVFAAARDVTDVRRTQAALEETNRDALLLAQMSDLLQSCQTVDEAIPVIEAAMRELFPGSDGRAFLFNSGSGMLDEAMTWGALPAGGPSIPQGDCWALRRNSPHEVGFGAPLAPPCHSLDADGRPYLCIPLVAHGTALGIVHLVAPGNQAPGERFRALARSTADSISLALANIRLRENLHALSTRDPLTGLYNRRFLEEALARELSRASRSRTSGVLAMLDIDHFKRFNDEFGHDAGDAVLVAVAHELGGFRRGSDLACRWGGEEFLLVLAEIGLDDAVTRLEGLRRTIGELAAFHDGHALPPITVSIGLAQFPHPGRVSADVITAADKALYRAKEGGRDRLVVSDDAPPAAALPPG